METPLNPPTPPPSADSPEAPQPPAPTASPYADTGTVLVIPRVTFNYVVIALVFFILGVVGTLLVSSTVFNANSEENRALLAEAVATFQASAPAVAAAPTDDSLIPGQRYDTITSDDDPAQGPAEAPVQVVEFSDFRCPFCKRFAQETLPLLVANFGDQVRFVYRDLPILSAESYQAALAGNCANQQGQFWNFHEWAYNNQQNLTREAFAAWAGTLSDFDTEAFTACLDLPATRDEVAADYQAVSALTSRLGTPMFFINGEFISGAQPYQVFADAINRALTAG